MSDFPWVAGVAAYSQSQILYCYGAMISIRHVLTAGHCLDRNLTAITVRVFHGGKIISIPAKRYIVNPNYTDLGTDLAIIEMSFGIGMKNPDMLDLSIFPTGCSTFSDQMMGAVHTHSHQLKFVRLAWRRCQPDHAYELSYEGRAQPGDSGSPLFYQGEGFYKDLIKSQLIGILSSVIYLSSGGVIEGFAPIARNKEFLKKYLLLYAPIYDSITIAESRNIQDWHQIPQEPATPATPVSAATAPVAFNLLSVLMAVLCVTVY